MADTGLSPEPIPLRQRKPLPATIEAIDPGDSEAGMTPNEMRRFKELSGLRLDYIAGDEADLDDKTQFGVWLALTRAGYEPSWEEAGDVRPIAPSEPPDPTSGEPSTGSPGSAATGG